MDETLLSSLGLSENEVRLYREVVKAKEITPTALAKVTGIKRTTAYSMARGLVEKGLLLEDGTRRPRVFAPTGPEEMVAVIEGEKRRFEERQELLQKLGEQVSMAQAENSYPVPRIRFIEEAKINTYFKTAFPVWMESMLETKEHGFWGFQDATLVEHYEDQLRYWWSISPDSLFVKLLTNLSPAEKKIAGTFERRHMKYWGEATNFVSSTWIVGDYVVMINTRQHPHYVIEIHSRVLAHDQREVFKNLWPLVA